MPGRIFRQGRGCLAGVPGVTLGILRAGVQGGIFKSSPKRFGDDFMMVPGARRECPGAQVEPRIAWQPAKIKETKL